MDTIVLVKDGSTYKVVVADYSFVTSSDMPELVGKPISAVWRWARQNAAKFYLVPFLPPQIERTYAISHAES